MSTRLSAHYEPQHQRTARLLHSRIRTMLALPVFCPSPTPKLDLSSDEIWKVVLGSATVLATHPLLLDPLSFGLRGKTEAFCFSSCQVETEPYS
jgi:hypothetical protein